MRQEERNNPKYAFLFDQALPAYHYFKMLQDSRYKPPPPLEFDDEVSIVHDLMTSLG